MECWSITYLRNLSWGICWAGLFRRRSDYKDRPTWIRYSENISCARLYISQSAAAWCLLVGLFFTDRQDKQKKTMIGCERKRTQTQTLMKVIPAAPKATWIATWTWSMWRKLEETKQSDSRQHKMVDDNAQAILWDLHYHSNPSLSNCNRKRPRIEFTFDHDDKETHQQKVRVRQAWLVPVPIGPSIPCWDREDSKEKHA